MRIPRWMYKAYLAITNDARYDVLKAADREMERRRARASSKRYTSINKSVEQMSNEELRRLINGP